MIAPSDQLMQGHGKTEKAKKKRKSKKIMKRWKKPDFQLRAIILHNRRL